MGHERTSVIIPQTEPAALPHHTCILENGVELIVVPMPHARSVSSSVYLRAGSRYEEHDQTAGVSHFLEHICFKGTERRPTSREISFEIDAIGGGINAATHREMTVYYGKVAAEFTERSIDLLLDMVRNSICPEEEIERERGVILEELAAVEDNPGFCRELRKLQVVNSHKSALFGASEGNFDGAVFGPGVNDRGQRF